MAKSYLRRIYGATHHRGCCGYNKHEKFKGNTVLRKQVMRALAALPAKPRVFGWTRGADMERDISLTCPETSIKRIFDVGANVGDVTLRYARRFPTATIVAFEPLPSLFRQLQAKTKSVDTVECFPFAVTKTKGIFDFIDYGPQSSSSHILSPGDGQSGPQQHEVISVEGTTIDDFCMSHSAPRIDILKIDVEGHDLDVLRGATAMLEQQEIGFIDIECGFDPDNRRHVPFFDVNQFLASFHYKVFGFYEQTNEFFQAEPQLRRANVTFVSEREVMRNAGSARRKPPSMLDVGLSIKRRFVK